MSVQLKPPMTYFGGKTRIAETIAALLPAHTHYVEPFCGSLAVLLAKPPSVMETVNDIDSELVTFWRVLRDRPADLERACALTPHSRAEQASSYDLPAGLDEVEIARRVWVQVTQGRMGVRSKTGWRMYIDPAGSSRSMPGYLDAYVERIAAAAERLKAVSLECRPALDVIHAFAGCEDVLIYADPPYLGSTRTSGKYKHEMADKDAHVQLAEALTAARAAVVLSGYASPLYDQLYDEWDRVEIPTTTGQGGTHSKRVEVVWSNRPISTPHLFSEVS